MTDERLMRIYERAMELYNQGFQLVILHKYQKGLEKRNWQNIYGIPVPGMTGFGIVGGSYVKSKNLYIYIIDIDVYEPVKRDEVLNEILPYFELKEIYLETSPSGGYHIVFYSANKITSTKQFKFNELFNPTTTGDKVEFFTNGQVLIAPSLAKNKNGVTGEYKQVSDTNLEDSAVLSVEELQKFEPFLDGLAIKYQSRYFNHNVITTEEHQQLVQKTYKIAKTEQKYRANLLHGGHRFSFQGQNDREQSLATGIQLEMGKQEDNIYLAALIYKKPAFPPPYSDSAYVEETENGDIQILFRTNRMAKISGKINDGQNQFEVLTKGSINIAPTYSYLLKTDSREPQYGTCKKLSGNLTNIPFINPKDLEILKEFQSTNSRPIENIDLKELNRYGKRCDINKQIQLVFPQMTNLLDKVNIRHWEITKQGNIPFFSIAEDDGNKPGACLFSNYNSSYKWAGYSVRDYHTKESMSFALYLYKYNRQMFEYLMNEIGFGKINIKIPIQTKYTGKTVRMTCDGYIDENQYIEVLKHILEAIENKKQPRIVITAPTGIGKTEMFYWLAKNRQIQTILSLPYTAQVHQGEVHHQTPGVIEGLCGNSHKTPVSGSIFMTYDKALLVSRSIMTNNHILVIDEAHNLVNQKEFRSLQIHNLTELSRYCRAIIYLTATPDYLNFKNVDLMIMLEKKESEKKKCSVVQYRKNLIRVLPDVIISQHQPGTIDIIYMRQIKTMQKIIKIIQPKIADADVHILFSQNKKDSVVYNNLSDTQHLAGNGAFQSGGFVFTTNLFIDGVNVKDNNIGNIYLINPESTTDLVQFPARFRNGYSNYYILTTGYGTIRNQFTRQEMIDRLYFRAYMQKKSFEKVKTEYMTWSFANNLENSFDNMLKYYDLLDEQGDIQDEKLLFNIQRQEAMKMRKDHSHIRNYLEQSDYGYNFSVDVIDIKSLSRKMIDENDVKIGLGQYKVDQEHLKQYVKDILTGECEEKDQLIMDYLSKKYYEFDILAKKYSVTKELNSGNFVDIISDIMCLKLLFKYCTGLNLGAINPIGMLDLNDGEVDSLKRSLTFLRNIKKDYKYYWLIYLRDWVRGLKNTDDSVEITSDMLKKFKIDFSKNHCSLGYSKDNKAIVNDLNDIFQVKKIKKSIYKVGNEWILNSIRGISFSPDHAPPHN